MKKWAHELNREFTKEEIQMANKYMKYSTALIIKEMQLKTAHEFHLTPVRMATFKSNKNNKCWQGCSEIETLYTVGVNAS
jgi:hypothetical protein